MNSESLPSTPRISPFVDMKERTNILQCDANNLFCRHFIESLMAIWKCIPPVLCGSLQHTHCTTDAPRNSNASKTISTKRCHICMAIDNLVNTSQFPQPQITFRNFISLEARHIFLLTPKEVMQTKTCTA